MATKVSKNQRVGASTQVVRRGARLDGPKCPYCQAPSRYKNVPARGRNNKERECENNHIFFHKGK